MNGLPLVPLGAQSNGDPLRGRELSHSRLGSGRFYPLSPNPSWERVAPGVSTPLHFWPALHVILSNTRESSQAERHRKLSACLETLQVTSSDHSNLLTGISQSSRLTMPLCGFKS